jgi:ribonuclease D
LANFHDGDLPDGAPFAGATAVAVDSETMGLRLGRDPLCVVQLSSGDGDAHVVQLHRPTYDAPNLKRLLTDPAVLKIFHFGRFDIAMFLLHLGVVTAPVYCTKIASKLARTYTDRHGLKDVTRELVGVELSKAQQSSDWGAAKLSRTGGLCGLRRAASARAARASRRHAGPRGPHGPGARRLRLPSPPRPLDLAGWEDNDIFAHA